MTDAVRDDIIKEILGAEKEITLFVRAHLYLEHYLDAAVEEKFPRQSGLLDEHYFPTELKLRLLHGMGFLSDVLYYNGLQMNRIRNKFAHKLEPSEDRIRGYVGNMLLLEEYENWLEWADDRIRGYVGNMLLPWKTGEAVEAMDMFEKYKNVAITTVLAIKNALEEGRDADFFPGTSVSESKK